MTHCSKVFWIDIHRLMIIVNIHYSATSVPGQWKHNSHQWWRYLLCPPGVVSSLWMRVGHQLIVTAISSGSKEKAKAKEKALLFVLLVKDLPKVLRGMKKGKHLKWCASFGIKITAKLCCWVAESDHFYHLAGVTKDPPVVLGHPICFPLIRSRCTFDTRLAIYHVRLALLRHHRVIIMCSGHLLFWLHGKMLD